MKKILFISMLITVGIILCNCNGNSDNTKSNNTVTVTNNTTTNTTTTNDLANGTYNASGTITFKAGDENYSCSISKVIAAPTVLTIQTSSKNVQTSGSITITCYTATKAVTKGTYSAATSEALSSVSFVDKKVTPFTATSGISGSSCTVNITALTSISIKGSFTAIVSPILGKSSVSIKNGVIDCTIASK